ncbi:MAG: thiamine biosynthesis lipoprotein ApbE [Myxococcaceae bacterium]|nr:thiamine biosynthesis lipoprotein ApbE [Myxococcaceae bacterium]
MRARCFALSCAWISCCIFSAAACRGPQDAPQPIAATSSAPTASTLLTTPLATSAASTAPFEPEKVTGEAKAMGTHLAYAAYTTRTIDAAAMRRAFDRATAEIQRIEALMTTWRPDSDLSRVNDAAPSTAIKVAPETFDVVAEALHTSAISEGTFDITFETLHGLWKFDEDLDPHPPDAARIKAKLPLVGYKHVKLDAAARTIALDTAGTKISLGGIAKGYAVDRAAKVLADAGLESFYVQAGGDLYARGKKPDGNDWSAGVRDPRGPEGSYFALLPLADHAFSTAGDYERSYITGGKRYHHIIDPRTGWPATASRSVTIWAPTAFVADAIDDAVFILGPKKGLELVESIDGVGAVIVDAKNNLWVSKRLAGKLQIVKPPTEGL